jgi:hypothetical protein
VVAYGLPRPNPEGPKILPATSPYFLNESSYFFPLRLGFRLVRSGRFVHPERIRTRFGWSHHKVKPERIAWPSNRSGCLKSTNDIVPKAGPTGPAPRR